MIQHLLDMIAKGSTWKQRLFKIFDMHPSVSAFLDGLSGQLERDCPLEIVVYRTDVLLRPLFLDEGLKMSWGMNFHNPLPSLLLSLMAGNLG